MRLNQKGAEEIGLLFLLVILGVGSFWSYSYFVKRNNWVLISLPKLDGSPVLNGSYTSKDTCLVDLHNAYYPNGECGRNCHLSDSGKLAVYVCDETAQ